MQPSRGLGFDQRFSLSEVMLAIAVDALLVTAIRDLTGLVFHANGQPLVYDALLVVSYLVVPAFVVPLYFATRRNPAGRTSRWHNRRNDVLMALDILVVATALSQPALHPLKDRGIELLIHFLPIPYTLYLLYALGVHRLRHGRATGEPSAPRPAGGVLPTVPSAAAIPADVPSEEASGRSPALRNVEG